MRERVIVHALEPFKHKLLFEIEPPAVTRECFPVGPPDFRVWNPSQVTFRIARQASPNSVSQPSSMCNLIDSIACRTRAVSCNRW
jgi:hypothetical protein